MAMKLALIFCVLILIPAGGLGCGGGGGGGGSSGGGSGGITVPSCCPENRSPSGGPSRNHGAAVCYFRRNSLRLECRIRGSSSSTCSAVKAQGSSEFFQNGPTPYGEYLIGKHRLSTNYPGLDWFNLYPKKENNSGYYGYYQANGKGRKTMGIHPGRVSLGCVTVAAPGCSSYSCYNRNSCWTKIRSIIKRGRMNYRGSSYSGILYVVR